MALLVEAAATAWLPAAVAGVDRTDGVRMTLASGEVAHLRASGNAPEMRVYVEADGEDAAGRLRDAVVRRVAEVVGGAL